MTLNALGHLFPCMRRIDEEPQLVEEAEAVAALKVHLYDSKTSELESSIDEIKAFANDLFGLLSRGIHGPLKGVLLIAKRCEAIQQNLEQIIPRLLRRGDNENYAALNLIRYQIGHVRIHLLMFAHGADRFYRDIDHNRVQILVQGNQEYEIQEQGEWIKRKLPTFYSLERTLPCLVYVPTSFAVFSTANLDPSNGKLQLKIDSSSAHHVKKGATSIIRQGCVTINGKKHPVTFRERHVDQRLRYHHSREILREDYKIAEKAIHREIPLLLASTHPSIIGTFGCDLTQETEQLFFHATTIQEQGGPSLAEILEPHEEKFKRFQSCRPFEGEVTLASRAEYFESLEEMQQHLQKYVLHYFSQLLRVVAFLEYYGLAHTDLNPKNILLQAVTNEGVFAECYTIKLIDFELCNELGSVRKKEGAPAIIPPEAADVATSTITNKYDGWALGILLYFLLSGDTPTNNCYETAHITQGELDEKIQKLLMKVASKKIYSEEEMILLDRILSAFLKVNPEERLSPDGYLRSDEKLLREKQSNPLKKDCIVLEDVPMPLPPEFMEDPIEKEESKAGAGAGAGAGIPPSTPPRLPREDGGRDSMPFSPPQPKEDSAGGTPERRDALHTRNSSRNAGKAPPVGGEDSDEEVTGVTEADECKD